MLDTTPAVLCLDARSTSGGPHPENSPVEHAVLANRRHVDRRDRGGWSDCLHLAGQSGGGARWPGALFRRVVHSAAVGCDGQSSGDGHRESQERRKAGFSKARPPGGVGDRRRRPAIWWTTAFHRSPGGPGRHLHVNTDLRHSGSGNVSQASNQRGRMAAISRPGLLGKPVHSDGRVASLRSREVIKRRTGRRTRARPAVSVIRRLLSPAAVVSRFRPAS